MSDSKPIRYTFMTGNMSIGATATTYATAKYFQPHDTAQVGTPLADPTEVTYTNFYLYDYGTISYIINNLYSSFNQTSATYSQMVHISGHCEYTVRNQTNLPTRYEMIRWSVKKSVPRFMCSITEYNDPAYVTNPVLTGNVLNFLGYAMLAANVNTSTSTATNTGLLNAEVALKELPLWNEYFDYKVVPFTLRPSQARKFSVGRKMLEIDTQEIFGPTFASTNAKCWTQAFIPGATGIIFRAFGEPCTLTGTNTDLAFLGYTKPESLLTTKFTYSAYAWKAQPEQQGHVYMTDFNISGSAANAGLRFINRDAAVTTVAVAI